MENRIITVMAFDVDIPYSFRDVSYMIPGIIHKVMEGDNSLLHGLIIDEFLVGGLDDKGVMHSKFSYYENMAVLICEMLDRLGQLELIRSMLTTHIVEEAQIAQPSNDLFLVWTPR